MRGGEIMIGAAAASIAAATSAAAEDRWYLSGAATIGRLNEAERVVANAPFPGSTLLIENEIINGWGGQIALGRSIGKVRGENVDIGVATHNIDIGLRFEF